MEPKWFLKCREEEKKGISYHGSIKISMILPSKLKSNSKEYDPDMEGEMRIGLFSVFRPLISRARNLPLLSTCLVGVFPNPENKM